MSISIRKMCRGQGTAYMLAEFSGNDCPMDFRFVAKDERETQLPLETYELEEEEYGVKGLVLSTPLLDTKKVIVNAYAKGVDDKLVWHRSFTREHIKWASRLFYKADWMAAHQLRDIDRLTFSNQIHVKPLYIHREPRLKQIIVKGIICSPTSASSVFARVLGADGKPVDEAVTILAGSSEVDSDGMRRTETSFTLRLPDNQKTYCLVAADDSDCRSGFLCFDHDSLEYLLSFYDRVQYPIAEGTRWDAAFRDVIKKRRLVSAQDYAFSEGPLFSIVVPLYNTPAELFHDMVKSVLDQVYAKWELILVNSTPDNEALSEALSTLSDQRIKIVTLADNLGISENTNKGIDAASGDFIVFFDHDDTLDKLALAKYAKVVCENPTVDAVYCDEDFLNEDGLYVEPHFKSAFNIDLLRAHNYITHLLAVRTSYVRKLPLRKEFDGAQDYDFLLRLSELTTNFYHVPEVLYHWRMSDTSTAKSAGNKSYADTAGLKALREHLARCGLNATAEPSGISFVYKTSYGVSGNPLVSIIIPNKDSAGILERCIDSIEGKTTYRNFEIIVIENNSREDKTFSYYEEVQSRFENVKVVYWKDAFNYSAINNFGYASCSGDYIVLLNNDTEVIDANWLGSMLGFCQREDVGVVGAKLLYPDDTIQHAGVAMIHCDGPEEMGGPIHVFGNLDRDNPGYFNRAILSQDLSMVTGACLMTKRRIFDELGGLNEAYSVAYNDVDYCLRVRREGFLVVYDADALLYHYESLSRGADRTGAKRNRFASEQGRLRLEWPEYYFDADEYHSRMMTKSNYWRQ